jgi:hypothetical protein
MNTRARQGLQRGGATQETLKNINGGSVNSVGFRPRDMVSPSIRKIRVRMASGTHAWHELLKSMPANHAGLENACRGRQ